MPQIPVWAKSDAIAAVLKHPNGVGFDPANNSASWPDDQFTQRRLADGDVLNGPVRGYVPAGQLTMQQLVKVTPPASTAPTAVKSG